MQEQEKALANPTTTISGDVSHFLRCTTLEKLEYLPAASFQEIQKKQKINIRKSKGTQLELTLSGNAILDTIIEQSKRFFGVRKKRFPLSFLPKMPLVSEGFEHEEKLREEHEKQQQQQYEEQQRKKPAIVPVFNFMRKILKNIFYRHLIYNWVLLAVLICLQDLFAEYIYKQPGSPSLDYASRVLAAAKAKDFAQLFRLLRSTLAISCAMALFSKLTDTTDDAFIFVIYFLGALRFTPARGFSKYIPFFNELLQVERIATSISSPGPQNFVQLPSVAENVIKKILPKIRKQLPKSDTLKKLRSTRKRIKRRRTKK